MFSNQNSYKASCKTETEFKNLFRCKGFSNFSWKDFILREMRRNGETLEEEMEQKIFQDTVY